MLFNRKIELDLINWKNKSKGSTALLIEGARRIGKSTSAIEFAKKNYKSYLLIDFANLRETTKQLFNNLIDNLDSFFYIIN